MYIKSKKFLNKKKLCIVKKRGSGGATAGKMFDVHTLNKVNFMGKFHYAKITDESQFHLINFFTRVIFISDSYLVRDKFQAARPTLRALPQSFVRMPNLFIRKIYL